MVYMKETACKVGQSLLSKETNRGQRARDLRFKALNNGLYIYHLGELESLYLGWHQTLRGS